MDLSTIINRLEWQDIDPDVLEGLKDLQGKIALINESARSLLGAYQLILKYLIDNDRLSTEELNQLFMHYNSDFGEQVVELDEILVEKPNK